MNFVDGEGFSVQPITVELNTSLVGVTCGHFDECKTIADDIHRNHRSHHAKEIFNGGALCAVREISNQEFLCGCHCLHTYADIRIFIHRQVDVKQYFEVAAASGMWH